jgi:hypothetical protein
MKWIKLFIYSAGGILLAAALIRFVIAAGQSEVFSLPEPMLGIPLRYAVLIVGGFELAVALICMFGKRTKLQLGWLAWLATNFIIFQSGLLLMHCHPQATAIGSLTDPLRIARGTTGIIFSLLPFYLIFGSYATLIWLWLGRKATKQPQAIVLKPVATTQPTLARFLKISCTACGGHIEFPTNFFGEKIPCPHCKTTITLQKARNLKISCPACAGRIEFPDYAVGQTIPCPHCKTDIILREPA